MKTLISFNICFLISLSSIFGQSDSTLVRSYFDSAGVYNDLRQYNKALEFLDLSLELVEKNVVVEDTLLAKVYWGKLDILGRQGNVEEAILYGQKAIDIFQKTGNQLKIAKVYQSFGRINLYSLDDFDEAMKYFQKSLNILNKLEKPDYAALSNLYISMTWAYMDSVRDYSKAEEYAKQALAVLEKSKKPDYYMLNEAYYTLAVLNDKKRNYDKSTEYYNKGLAYYRKKVKVEDNTVIRTIHALSVTFASTGKYDKSLEYLRKVLNYQNKVKDEDTETALTYSLIGFNYFMKGDYNQSIENYKKTIDIQTKGYGDFHHHVAWSHFKIGNVYLSKKDTLNAFRSYVAATESARLNLVNKNTDNLSWNKTFITYLTSVIKFRPYIQNDSIPNQKELINLLLEATDKYSNKILETNSRLAFQRDIFLSYNEALEYAHQWTPRDKVKEFSYSERCKSTLLLSEVRNTYIEAYNDLPEAVREEDINSKKEITELEKLLIGQKQNKDTSPDSSTIAYEQQLFDLKREREQLLKNIQQDYSNYYQLKYDNSTAEVADIQALLAPDQALLEYFVGDSTIYIFTLTPKTLEVTTLKKDFPLEDWVNQLREGIYLPMMNTSLSSAKKDSLQQQYVNAAHNLYQKLLANLPVTLPQRLIIVPDGVLGYVPFDALLKSKPQDLTAYKSYDFVLKDHAISYNYSATLYQQILEKKPAQHHKNILAIAPSFGSAESVNFIANRSIDELRDTLLPLRYNVPEVAYLYEHLGADTLTHQHATLARFQEMAKDYQIVHLSTHGKANDKTGNYSYLAFTEIKDSIENEKLYVQELYNLELNADMVVLSACETGLGELKKGEGIIGMSRGFFYAGAKSIITTLWSVNDKSTQDFMQFFYKNVAEELPKDVALQQAKLALLDRNYPEPFYWAGFVPMGDMAVLDLSSGFNWWYLSGGVTLLLLLFFFLKSKISPKTS